MLLLRCRHEIDGFDIISHCHSAVIQEMHTPTSSLEIHQALRDYFIHFFYY